MLRTLAPHLLMPGSVAIMLLIGGAWARSRRACLAAMALLWLASAPAFSNTLMMAVEGWSTRLSAETVDEADAIVVLSGSFTRVENRAGGVEFEDFDRFLAGFDLYSAGRAPRIVFTGGRSPGSGDPELFGAILARRARDFGIGAEAIVVTAPACNTEEEAIRTASILDAPSAAAAVRPESDAPQVVPRVILVTSAFHMPRATELFRKHGFAVIPFPVDFRRADHGPLPLGGFIPSPAALGQTHLALREVYGRLYYSLF